MHYQSFGLKVWCHGLLFKITKPGLGIPYTYKTLYFSGSKFSRIRHSDQECVSLMPPLTPLDLPPREFARKLSAGENLVF